MTRSELVFWAVMQGNSLDEVGRWHAERPQRIRQVVYTEAKRLGLYHGKLPSMTRLRARWAARQAGDGHE